MAEDRLYQRGRLRRSSEGQSGRQEGRQEIGRDQGIEDRPAEDLLLRTAAGLARSRRPPAQSASDRILKISEPQR